MNLADQPKLKEFWQTMNRWDFGYNTWTPDPVDLLSRRQYLANRFNLKSQLIAQHAFQLIDKNAALPSLVVSTAADMQFGKFAAAPQPESRKLAAKSFSQDAIGFAIVAMITHFEIACRTLWLESNLAYKAVNPAFRMTATVVRKNHKDFNRICDGPIVDLCLRRLVTAPSALLMSMSRMLISLDRMRNCFVHNRGIVDIQAVVGKRLPSDDEFDTATRHGTLRCVWLRTAYTVGGKLVDRRQLNIDHLRHPTFGVAIREVGKDFRIHTPIELDQHELSELAYSLSSVLLRVGQELLQQVEKAIFGPDHLVPALPDHWPVPILRVSYEEAASESHSTLWQL